MPNIYIILAVILVMVLFAWLVGMTISREHRISRSIHVAHPAASIWSVITNYAAQPTWHPDIEEVIRLEGDTEWRRWRELHSRDVVKQVHVVEAEPPHRVVWAFHEEHGLFKGRWNVELRPDAEGTTIRITQHVTLESPWARLGALVVRRGSSLALYLGALETHLANLQSNDAPH